MNGWGEWEEVGHTSEIGGEEWEEKKEKEKGKFFSFIFFCLYMRASGSGIRARIL